MTPWQFYCIVMWCTVMCCVVLQTINHENVLKDALIRYFNFVRVPETTPRLLINEKNVEIRQEIFFLVNSLLIVL